MFTPSLRHLFHPVNIEEYLDSISAGADHLAATMGKVAGPSAGTTPAKAAAPIARIDLDAPADGITDALDELSRVYLDEADHPELAEAAKRYDLLRPEFQHSCLNRLQLRNTLEMVDLAGPVESMLHAGTLLNPAARGF